MRWCKARYVGKALVSEGTELRINTQYSRCHLCELAGGEVLMFDDEFPHQLYGRLAATARSAAARLAR